MNCVSVQHKIVNGSVTDARWYAMSCGQMLPYTCQKHAYDFNNSRSPTLTCIPLLFHTDRLAAGLWNVHVHTAPNQRSNRCTVGVRVQTDLQVILSTAGNVTHNHFKGDERFHQNAIRRLPATAAGG